MSLESFIDTNSLVRSLKQQYNDAFNSSDSAIEPVSESNVTIDITTSKLPFDFEHKTKSLENIQVLFPTLKDWVAQFSGLRIAYIGKGPFPISGKSIEQHYKAFDIVIKQVPIVTTYNRFIEEVHILQRLQQETEKSENKNYLNTAKYLGHYFDGSTGFIAFEALSGMSLMHAAQIVKKKQSTELKSGILASFNIQDAETKLSNNWNSILISIEKQVLYLHALGIAHKDLHEYNIIIDSNTFQPWIIDFGRAITNPEVADFEEDLSAVKDFCLI